MFAGVMNDASHSFVVHYSCESFYERSEGTSPRITSIALRNIESGQTSSFSIHQVAERRGLKASQIDRHYDSLEKQMLDEFYAFVDRHRTYNYMHWNMRDINFGFQAIEHRYRVLSGDPVEIQESNKLDLARVMVNFYGVRYVGHPRLQKLVEKNRITDRDFLSGAEEAAAFEEADYVKLHLSTLRKVDVMANIAHRFDEGTLETNASFRDKYGVHPQAVIELVREHWIVGLLGLVVALIALGRAIFWLIDVVL
jgi:hypothetical protein